MRLKDILNEEVYALPQTPDQTIRLGKALSAPMPASEAEERISSILWTDTLKDIIGSMIETDPSQDSRQAIFDYLNAEYPLITSAFTSYEQLRDFNLEGTLSVMGHKDEESEAKAAIPYRPQSSNSNQT